MIIECGHCGAPLDVKAEARVTKCAYCGMSNQVNTQRTIAFETPQGWQPPPKWVPPQQFSANSQRELTYRAARSGGLIFAIVMVAVVGVIGAVVATVVSSVTTTVQHVTDVEREVDRATREANDAIAQALAQASAAQEEALGKVPAGGVAAPQLSLLTNAGVKQALDVYKQAIGVQTLSAMEITLHDEHSSAELQSPKDPAHVDEYSYLLGRVKGPDPKRLMGREKANLKAFLFDPEKTALLDIESLKTKAMGKLAYEQAKITHVIAERDRGKIVIRVYASNPRESGYVAFDEKGKVTRVAR